MTELSREIGYVRGYILAVQYLPSVARESRLAIFLSQFVGIGKIASGKRDLAGFNSTFSEARPRMPFIRDTEIFHGSTSAVSRVAGCAPGASLAGQSSRTCDSKTPLA